MIYSRLNKEAWQRDKPELPIERRMKYYHLYKQVNGELVLAARISVPYSADPFDVARQKKPNIRYPVLHRLKRDKHGRFEEETLADTERRRGG